MKSKSSAHFYPSPRSQARNRYVGLQIAEVYGARCASMNRAANHGTADTTGSEKDGHRTKRLKRGHTRETEIEEPLRPPTTSKTNRQNRSALQAQSDRNVPSEKEDRQSTVQTVDLDSVPSDPYQQQLWVAKAIKDLAAEKGGERDGILASAMVVNQKPQIDTRTSSKPHINGHNDSPKNDGQALRSSGRKRRQTNKAKDAYLAEMDGLELDQAPSETNHSHDALEDPPIDLPGLLVNSEVRKALFLAPQLSPDKLVKRHACGDLFLRSLAQIESGDDTDPATRLRSSLRRRRDDGPFLNALRALAGSPQVIRAIDKAFGDLGDITKPRGLQNSLNEQIRPDKEITSHDPPIQNSVAIHGELPKDTSPQKRIPRTKAPTDQHLDFSQPTASSAPPIAVEPMPQRSRPGSANSRKNSQKVASALKAATSVLDDMAYGGLKYYFTPYGNSAHHKYTTPYGPPSKDYVTPYPQEGTSQTTRLAPDSTAPISREHNLQLHPVNAFSQNVQMHPNGVNSLIPRNPNGFEYQQKPFEFRQVVPEPQRARPSVGASAALARPPSQSSNVLNDKPQTKTSEGDEGYALSQEQIDGFLALASGGNLTAVDDDSDEETDSDQNKSRSSRRDHEQPGDALVDSVVQGIIAELRSGQNWGHGLGFLTPQAHLHQINNAERFASDLKTHIDNARLRVNYLVTSEQSKALESLYDALIKRITNPYSDGKPPVFSNIVYHNGKAYHAIPGPAHPMYNQPPHSTQPAFTSPPAQPVPPPPMNMLPAHFPPQAPQPPQPAQALPPMQTMFPPRPMQPMPPLPPPPPPMPMQPIGPMQPMPPVQAPQPTWMPPNPLPPYHPIPNAHPFSPNGFPSNQVAFNQFPVEAPKAKEIEFTHIRPKAFEAAPGSSPANQAFDASFKNRLIAPRVPISSFDNRLERVGQKRKRKSELPMAPQIISLLS